MKQIIPFKKELLFKTKVSEITAISLEHNLTLKEDDLISGEFYITGDYKMTEGSINREKFDFKLPFDIALDARYDLSSIVIDIDNFYYEIINNESLQVNIDVYVEGDKKEELTEITEEEITEEEITEDYQEIKEEPIKLPQIEDLSSKEETREIFDIDLSEDFQKTIEKEKQPIVSFEQNEPNKDINFNIFENIDNSETYTTYYVYIVKEEDTLDKILTKYNATKEDIALYNDIEKINPGTKLIIPNNCNE